MLDLNAEALAEIVAARVAEMLRTRNRTSAVVPEYLTPHEASILLNYPVKTLENWRLKGEGPPFTRRGRHVRYHIEALRAFMSDGD